MQRCQTSPDRECTSLEDIHNLCLPGARWRQQPVCRPAQPCGPRSLPVACERVRSPQLRLHGFTISSPQWGEVGNIPCRKRSAGRSRYCCDLSIEVRNGVAASAPFGGDFSIEGSSITGERKNSAGKILVEHRLRGLLASWSALSRAFCAALDVGDVSSAQHFITTSSRTRYVQALNDLGPLIAGMSAAFSEPPEIFGSSRNRAVVGRCIRVRGSSRHWR